MVIYYRSDTKLYAQELRKNMTPQEKHLWYDFLKSYPIQFHRQRQISCYIADFYCAAAKLIIEIDGSQHYTSEVKAYDEKRTEKLELQGFHVIRFTNEDVDKRFEGVCLRIDRIASERCGVEPQYSMVGEVEQDC